MLFSSTGHGMHRFRVSRKIWSICHGGIMVPLCTPREFPGATDVLELLIRPLPAAFVTTVDVSEFLFLLGLNTLLSVSLNFSTFRRPAWGKSRRVTVQPEQALRRQEFNAKPAETRRGRGETR
jgi:hypothetical protein